MAYRRKEQKVSKLSATISLAFHGLIVGTIVFFAAHEGMLGKQLKKIAVTMVPKEKPPEKPKEKPPEKPIEKPADVKPKEELAKAELPKPEPITQPQQQVAPAVQAGPAVAPPAGDVPGFEFEGGKLVESSSNPRTLYKGFVEYTLRSNWKRPEGTQDLTYVAEVELAIATDGRILSTEWKKGSGDTAWDNSVKQVIATTRTVGRPPPKGFPDKVTVRFDVQAETDALNQ